MRKTGGKKQLATGHHRPSRKLLHKSFNPDSEVDAAVLDELLKRHELIKLWRNGSG
jgi:hypothetical protein